MKAIISDDELQEIIKRFKDRSADGKIEPGIDEHYHKMLRAFRELQKYREALRFKSFDELPEEPKYLAAKIEIKSKRDDVSENIESCYCKNGYVTSSHVGPTANVEWNNLKEDYTGWRYPIGDLLAEDK